MRDLSDSPDTITSFNLRAIRLFAPLLIVLAGSTVAYAGAQSKISRVSTTREFFNPTLRETVSLEIEPAVSGTVRITVVDRDGFPIRHLEEQRAERNRKVVARWDGRDDAGSVVPDEAYSFKVDLVTSAGTETYFPALKPARSFTIRADSFDSVGGILHYNLPVACRVHIQAGSAKFDKAGNADGPVLKTIVNRAPRAKGAVVEHWSGFDESGTIKVSEMENFVIAIAPTSLPENSVLTTGNRQLSFLGYAESRGGQSLLPRPEHRDHQHRHHAGLSALEDHSPSLNVVPADASWIAEERVWTTAANEMIVRLDLAGPTASKFAEQPGRIAVFVNQRQVLEVKPASATTITIPLPRGTGDHIVALNWASEYGPVAVNSFRVRKSPKS